MVFTRSASLAVGLLRRSSLDLFSKALKDGRSCRVPLLYSTNATNLNVTVDSSEGIAVVELKRKPVNSLNLELLTELTTTLEKLENDKQINGLILTSAQPKIFSAGLDIMEMYNPKPERVREFWKALQNFWMKLYVSPLATVAAINGHSPAGGCLIALSCDHRIMASGPYSIGLNETLLGIVAPFWFMDSMKNVVGHREAERALQLGRLYSADEALKVGLVDEVVPETAVVQHAKEELVSWLQVPGHARQLTKLALRKPTVDQLVARQEEDIATFIKFVSKDAIQKSLAKYLEALKRKN
jgi:3,2-trans-enoyl-CoA isomerase